MSGKRGRPVGSTESVQSQLRGEIKQTILLNQKIRKLCDAAVGRINQWMSSDPSPQAALQVLGELKSVLEANTKGLGLIGKTITEKEPSQNEATGEDILKELMG